MGSESRREDPLAEATHHDRLKSYVTGVVGHFKGDKRIHAWDLFNEPDNPNHSSYGKVELPSKAKVALVLLEKSFAWARERSGSAAHRRCLVGQFD